MAQRLVNYTRDAIILSVMKAAFDAREAALKAELAQIAEEVYEDLYRKHADKMAAMPNGFLLELSQLRIKFDEQLEILNFPEARRVAHCHKGSVARVYEPSHLLAKRYAKYTKAANEFDSDESKARSQAKAVVYSARTYEQLIKVWPEIEPHAKKFSKESGKAQVYALALPIADLNARLGLTKKAA